MLYMEESIKTINLRNIIYNSLSNNKSIIISMISLCTAYWLQDVIFPNTFSNFTGNVPEFVNNINTSKVFNLLFPYLIAELLFYINNIIISRAIPEIEIEIVKQITEETFQSLKTSKTTININEYVMNLKKIIESKTLYYLITSYIIPTFLIAIGLVYQFAKGNMKMGIVVSIIMCVFFIVTYNFQKTSINSSYDNENAMNKFYDDIQDIMSNHDTVITSRTNNFEINKLDKSNVKQTYIESELNASSSTFYLHNISLITTVLLNGISFKMYANGESTKEMLISIAIMSILFMQYYNSTIIKLKNTVHNIGKLYEINDYFSQFKIHNKNIPPKFVIGDGVITFKKINLSYENKQVLTNFNHVINSNEITGIIGKVGSGKTSLLKMIAGLINYDGDIYIDGQNIKIYDYDSVIKNIAYIPQHPKMFNNTIYYNLTYGAGFDKKHVISFLKEIQFYDFFNSFEHGLDTHVGKEGNILSGGQKQIIALLRALLKNKKIILLDEPTSALDMITKQKVINLIKNTKNKTLLIVSHDEDIKKICNKIITFG